MVLLLTLLNESYDLYLQKLSINQVVQGTVFNARTKLQNINSFLLETKQTGILAKDVNYAFAENLKRWLELNIQGCQTHTNKHIRWIKAVLNEAELFERIPKNKIDKWRGKQTDVFKNNHLEVDELQQLQTLVLRPCLKKALDLFTFACYTGLGFAELEIFDPTIHLVQMDGKPWIRIKRKKTEKHGSEYFIPFLNEASQILDKYEKVLPKMKNQKMNTYLKEIMLSGNISTKLTTHSARKTFAIIASEKMNFSMEAISYMLGHENTKTTEKHYARVRLNKVKNEFLKMQL